MVKQVVNNAGAAYPNKATEKVTEKDFDLVMNVNVKSVYLSTNVIVPYFVEHKIAGSFVQIASTAGGKLRFSGRPSVVHLIYNTVFAFCSSFLHWTAHSRRTVLMS